MISRYQKTAGCLATVPGGKRYAVTVWCEQSAKKGGSYSRCTCPVGASGCKHAVAVVAEYLERLGEGAETPAANQDDERWELLADETGDADEDDVDDLELDMDSEDDEVDEEFYVHRHRHQALSEKKTRNATDEKIRKHIEAKNREELVALVWSLTERFPELREEFSDRIALGEGNVDRLVTETRKILRLVASEAGWRNSWTGAVARKSAARRDAWFQSYVTTVLQRDIRDLANIADSTAVPRLPP